MIRETSKGAQTPVGASVPQDAEKLPPHVIAGARSQAGVVMPFVIAILVLGIVAFVALAAVRGFFGGGDNEGGRPGPPGRFESGDFLMGFSTTGTSRAGR
jgi:hypothetical protein